jgi:iron complex outermembrane receptor protein
VVLDPTANPARTAAIEAFAAQSVNGAAVLSTLTNYNIVVLLDGRSANIARTKAAGLDLSVNYNRPTGFGSINASVNANWMLKEDTQLSPGAAFVDGLRQGLSTFRIAAMVGAEMGNIRASATWRHRGGFNVDPAATRLASQTRIGAFDVVDLAFRWRVNGSSALTEDLDLTLNVSNVFDAHPPINLTTTGGPVNGSTLGRLFQFGVAKSF